MIKSPKHIHSIQRYIPGKPVEELERELGISDSVKLASNENPVGPSPMALKALKNAVSGLHRYPDGNCYYLRDALAAHLETDPEGLIFGNGSNELIELAVRTFLAPGEKTISAHPSFVVYPTITQAAKGTCTLVPLKENRHDLMAMASKITARTRIIFIANPNNPTGTINTAEEVDEFMKVVPDNILVVFDEAYYEYVSSGDYAESLKHLKAGRSILILRTFSKMYGLAGLRIGYGITSPEIAMEINKVRQPFNVNSLAQIAAVAALQDLTHIAKSKKNNEQGKQFFYRELTRLGLEYIPTEANFIYISLKDRNSSELNSVLLKEGVIIRPAGPSSIRITIGLPGENKRMISALEKAIA
ncbi:MAG: histidinol-phosphate transaminase [Nitrospira sp.]|nr:histidinol-phosphate transaminase [bacterium]MBL7050315.1 histidinol-phosphate transaminase [Nitrospira sp.]